MAEAKAFDAILMDISMPVMDGPEATRLIRTGRGASARTPIIAVTAHALPEEVARFREAGMADCISKPINRGELLDLVARLLDPEAAPRDAAPSPEPEADLIDEAHLSDLLTGLPEASRATLLERFLKEMDEAIPRLAASPEEDGLVAVVHKCAGSCGTFGLIGLRTALARLESAFKRGDAVDAAELRALAHLWQRSRRALMMARLPA
jgi:CheY-like chemotaxis protein